MFRLSSIIVLLFFTQLCFAQVRATTESGNRVLLFEDGTWKYEEKTVAPVAKETVAAVVPVGLPTVAIDSTKEFETETTELFYLPSPRLVKYFGEERGQIRCKISCSNNNGEIRIHYKWEVPVGDGIRYFGYLKAGTKLTVHMQDGQKIELLVGEDSNIKTMERYNFTAIHGATKALTNEQLVALTSQPFRKIEVDWKKKPEDYEIELSKYFMETLPTVY
jgi:hypothetical protein